MGNVTENMVNLRKYGGFDVCLRLCRFEVVWEDFGASSLLECNHCCLILMVMLLLLVLQVSVSLLVQQETIVSSHLTLIDLLGSRPIYSLSEYTRTR